MNLNGCKILTSKVIFVNIRVMQYITLLKVWLIHQFTSNFCSVYYIENRQFCKIKLDMTWFVLQKRAKYDRETAPYTDIHNSGISAISVVQSECYQEMGSRWSIHKSCGERHIEHMPTDVGFKWWIYFHRQGMDLPAWGKLSSWYKIQKGMFQKMFHVGAVLVKKKRKVKADIF